MGVLSKGVSPLLSPLASLLTHCFLPLYSYFQTLSHMNYLSHVTNLVQIISYHYIFFKIHTIYLLFLAVPALRCCAGFSLAAVIKGCSLPAGSHCGGLSRLGARLQGMWTSGVAVCGLSSYGSRTLEHRLNSCGTWALMPHGKWDPPGPGIEPMSSALAARLSTTEPPRKLMITS